MQRIILILLVLASGCVPVGTYGTDYDAVEFGDDDDSAGDDDDSAWDAT